jgi:hypothetical protein
MSPSRGPRNEIVGHHNSRASNGPTDRLGPCVMKAKRGGHGFRPSTTSESAGAGDPSGDDGWRAAPVTGVAGSLGHVSERPTTSSPSSP